MNALFICLRSNTCVSLNREDALSRMSSAACSDELSSSEPMSLRATGMMTMVLVFFILRAVAASEPSLPATDAALVVVRSMPSYSFAGPG